MEGILKEVKDIENKIKDLEKQYADECSLIDTDEERALTKKSVELHEIANKSLTKKNKSVRSKTTLILYARYKVVSLKKPF